MGDVVLRPVVQTSGSRGYCFKVECKDAMLLIDLKREISDMLVGKDFDVEFQTGWFEP